MLFHSVFAGLVCVYNQIGWKMMRVKELNRVHDPVCIHNPYDSPRNDFPYARLRYLMFV